MSRAAVESSRRAKRAAVTQAQLNRTIKAVLNAGLPVTGVIRKPDGTAIVATVPLAPELDNPKGGGVRSWDEAIAELESRK